MTFEFQHPWVLLNLLWVPLWLFVAVTIWRSHRFIRHSSTLPFLQFTKKPHRLPLLVRACTLTSLIFALARPQGVLEATDDNDKGIDIMLALDLSASMTAKDFSIGLRKRTSRIEAAKSVLKDFIKNRDHDRIGLVSFAREAWHVSPLTLNKSHVLDCLERLHVGVHNGDGTAIGSAVSACINRMKDSKAKTHIIVLLTDGINNSGNVTPTMAAKVAKTFRTKIYTVMVGKDKLVSKEEQLLVEMAETTDGRFYRASDIKTLQGIYREIDSLEKSNVSVESYKDRTEYFQYPLFLALLLLGFEFYLKTRRYRILS